MKKRTNEKTKNKRKKRKREDIERYDEKWKGAQKEMNGRRRRKSLGDKFK